MQNISIVSADTLPSDHPAAKLKAMLDNVKVEPIESVPDIKTKTTSTTSTTSSDKKDAVDGLTTAMMELSIKPATLQIYPRTHLFGIPQELQDQIFDWVYDYPTRSGASNLEPLLTCRHVYHIAHEKAWASTIFELDAFNSDQLVRVLTAIPAGLESRKIFELDVTAAQIKTLIKFIAK